MVRRSVCTCPLSQPKKADAARRRARRDGWVGALDVHSQLWLDMAMKRVGVAELKDQLSRHLRAVEAGAEVEVTDRDRPIARIIPVRPMGHIVIEPARVPFASFRARRHPAAEWATNSTDLLLQERQAR